MKRVALVTKNVQVCLKLWALSDRAHEIKCISIASKRIGVFDGRSRALGRLAGVSVPHRQYEWAGHRPWKSKKSVPMRRRREQKGSQTRRALQRTVVWENTSTSRANTSNFVVKTPLFLCCHSSH
ncbi:hypothetical protein NL676_000243 [Syzygium grande]|nr:hypothetical protein NL676_000243 [Syzygium grande]